MNNQANSKTLKDMMCCGIFSNKDGKIMFLHGLELKGNLQWIEYNLHSDDLTLVFENGDILQAGIKFNDQTRENFQQGVDILFTHVENKKILSSKHVPMVIQNY